MSLDERALTAAARALCRSLGDDWLREGPQGLMSAYGSMTRAAIEAYQAALRRQETEKSKPDACRCVGR